MPISEAMRARHMVRKYTDKPLPADIVEKLQERIDGLNAEHDVKIALALQNTDGFSPAIKLVLAKGVRNFFVMAGPDDVTVDERLGYCGAELMLLAQELGLNTWWVGGTFSRKGASAVVDASAKVVGIVAVGYGATQGAPHKTKAPSDVAAYKVAAGDAVAAESEWPAWFSEGVEAALLAPTALAKQSFEITCEGNAVRITCDNGIFTGVDLGLVRYHFEQGAGRENFTWV